MSGKSEKWIKKSASDKKYNGNSYTMMWCRLLVKDLNRTHIDLDPRSDPPRTWATTSKWATQLWACRTIIKPPATRWRLPAPITACSAMSTSTRSLTTWPATRPSKCPRPQPRRSGVSPSPSSSGRAPCPCGVTSAGAVCVWTRGKWRTEFLDLGKVCGKL